MRVENIGLATLYMADWQRSAAVFAGGGCRDFRSALRPAIEDQHCLCRRDEKRMVPQRGGGSLEVSPRVA